MGCAGWREDREGKSCGVLKTWSTALRTPVVMYCCTVWCTCDPQEQKHAKDVALVIRRNALLVQCLGPAPRPPLCPRRWT